MSNVRKGKDISKKVYERLTAIEPTSQRENGGIVWKCICECGNKVYTTVSNLEQGNYKSCGCLKSEILVETHKQKAIKIYPDTNATGYTGVTFRKKDSKYIATIYFEKKHYYLGYYNTAKEASDIREIADEAKKKGAFLEWYEKINKKTTSHIRIRVSQKEKQQLEIYAKQNNKDITKLIREYIATLKIKD